MKKITLLSTIIILILVSLVLLNSINIPAPTKHKEYEIPLNQFI